MGVQKKTTTRNPIVKIIIGVLLLFLLSISLKLYEDVFASSIELAKNEKGYLYVGTKLTLAENELTWKQSGLFKNLTAFTRMLKLLGYETKIKPGRYEVDGSMNNYKLLKMMVGGQQKTMDIVFKYAERKKDLIQFWTTQLEADSLEMALLMNDTSLFEECGMDTITSVLLYIPNTYNFYWNTSAEDLILRMKKEYIQFWNDERKIKANQLNLTPIQVAIMASIVQKETYQKSEMARVAGVYYNRMQKGMPFQADPTILFILNDKSIRRVSGNMLQIESPYNTYIKKGLTPGPICIPSATTIDAVLNAEKHNYLYFCAKEDFSGFHNFAANFAQHQLNARKYQRELNKRGIR